jgi:hypothetical protein
MLFDEVKLGTTILFFSSQLADISSVYDERGYCPITFNKVVKVMFYGNYKDSKDIFKFEITLIDGSKSIRVMETSNLKKVCDNYPHIIIDGTIHVI